MAIKYDCKTSNVETTLRVWASAGGTGVDGRPPLEKIKKYLCGGSLQLSSVMGGLFHHIGDLFWACPPPYENFCGRPCRLRANIVV